MTDNLADLLVIYEHPSWQEPLFEALDRRGVNYKTFDLKQGVFGERDLPPAKLAFNQASPSAYLRGNTRAVPFGLAYIEALEASGVTVLNGSRAFRFELSKSTQARVMALQGIEGKLFRPMALTVSFALVGIIIGVLSERALQGTSRRTRGSQSEVPSEVGV